MCVTKYYPHNLTTKTFTSSRTSPLQSTCVVISSCVDGVCMVSVNNVCTHVDIDEEPVEASPPQTESEISSSTLTKSAMTSCTNRPPVEEYDAKPPLKDLGSDEYKCTPCKLHAYISTYYRPDCNCRSYVIMIMSIIM